MQVLLGATEKDGVTYRRIHYRSGADVYLSDELWRIFRIKFGHKNRTKRFPYFQNLVTFLLSNPSINLHLSESPEHRPFVINGHDYFVNIDSYIEFCKKIQSSTDGLAQAFFGQHIDPSSFLTEDTKRKAFASATADEIHKMLTELPENKRKQVIKNIMQSDGETSSEESPDDFAQHLEKSTVDKEKRKIVIASYQKIQLATLKEHREFLARNLDKEEMFIQDWIDGKIDNLGNKVTLGPEGIERLKRSRCLIFGLEFINHKREGSASQKRFDVLTKMSDGRNEYVLIELKSPCGSIFNIKTVRNKNDGVSTTYSLSEDIARAIPQISHYKGLLRDASHTDWQRYGLSKGEVIKSIILVGTRIENDKVWDEHYTYLKQGLSSSIEIITYTDLLEKLDSTIRNLTENL